MKKITAIIRPIKIEDVRIALAEIGINSMTLTEVKGLGRQEGYIEIHRGVKNYVNFLSNIQLEIIVEDDLVQDCVEVICTAARTGKVGDGKIYISNIEKIIRIRTGEENECAL